MARRLPALVVVLLAFVATAAASPALASSSAKQEFEARVDSYPPAKRNALRAHLRRALSRLRGPRTQVKVAAAINSYVYQRLRRGPSRADGVSGLEDGIGICGGAATSMVELLYLAGIRSHHVALLGIPLQGNHSLVQAYFRHRRAGLFDPTFGVFWYSRRRRRPVPLERLLRDPAVSLRTLRKSRNEKRVAASDAVVPIAGIGSGYALRRNYSEHPAGRAPQMDWYRAFKLRGGAGIASSGRPLQARIRLWPGDSYGNERWDGTTATPWTKLATTEDRVGLTLPWAFQIGQNPHGFDVRHSYRLRGLEPGRRYRLRLVLAQARGATLAAALGSSRRPIPKLRLRDLYSVPAGSMPPAVTIPFTATRSAMRLRVSVHGFAMFQALSLR